MDLAAAKGEIQPIYRYDSRLDALQRRGMEHEARYIEHLRGLGRPIHRVEETHDRQLALQRTIEAMRSGVDVIVQPTLLEGRWHGRADVLLRAEKPSNLGDWSYEAVDTKLTQETKAGTILQLCVYSHIVAGIQGRLPEYMYVVVPGRDFEPERYRTSEYFAYYSHVKDALQYAVNNANATKTYPEPVPHCDVCRWWPVCDRQWRDDDHLCLAAGISRLQRQELQTRHVTTLAALSKIPLPLQWKPSRGSVEGYEKVREQARMQVMARLSGRPEYELLTFEAERGLARMPSPSRGDIFFDFEGDPFVDPGGLEFLWGWVIEKDGNFQYQQRWSFTRTEERGAFEGFVDFVMERWQQHPDLHIYHYSPYEPSALKRLMGRYASREAEVDRMLRAGLFVDLYAVVRQSLRAGIERYSIKDLEIFFGYKRCIPLSEVSPALRAVEYGLELNDPAGIAREDREKVRIYNADDCYATRGLRDWLERLRQQCIDAGERISRPPLNVGTPPESVTAWQRKIQPVRDKLLQGLPADIALRSPQQQAQWLLAHMLEFHRREVKAPWWEFFRLANLSADELIDERDAISGLRFVERVGGKDRNPIHRYMFPFQETAIEPGDTLQVSKDEKIGTVDAIHVGEGSLDIKKRQDARDKHPPAVFTQTIYPTEELEESLFRIAQSVAANGIDGAGPYRAGRDLLLRCSPRLPEGTMLQYEGEDAATAARRLVPLLDHTTLCIQGPPGTGKTHTAADMAIELVKGGKTVGVCALSHKVVRNLLKAIVRAGKKQGLELQCIQKITEPLGNDMNVTELADNAGVLNVLMSGLVKVVGGTAWLWARADFAETVDVLFLDEAGQFPLANAVAISQGARSLVLVGDPQQLEAPLQGAHPDGTEVSALHHVLLGQQTMPVGLGLFLAETRRLAPRICDFTSEQFYESRLVPYAGAERQMIEGHGIINRAGLWFAPTAHDGNRNSSSEEVARVAALVNSFLKGGVTWTDPDGQVHPIALSDILVVTPYNAQVAQIRRAIPGIHAGTVDKFQGQEAPIVIYSLATSSPEDAPRGMEFLYSLNRLNVATSRARCACILVANPSLLEPDCRTPRQMRLANAFCRYLELAQRC
jgi:predicted RecB family nuclease